MAALFSILSFPIIVLNLVGGIAGGLWLAILGRWSDVGIGLAAMVLGILIINLALLPSLIFSMPFQRALKTRNYALAYPLGALGLLWPYGLLAIWCVGWFVFFLARVHSLWPTLLWSYTVATAPWVFIAARERQGDPDTSAGMPVFGAEAGCIVMMAMVFVAGHPLPIHDLAIGFAVPLLICLSTQLVIVVLNAKNDL